VKHPSASRRFLSEGWAFSSIFSQWNSMITKTALFLFKLNLLIGSEEAQDLVEYALVVALVAFGAVASMHTLATKVSSTFTQVGTSLSTTIT